MSDLNSTSARLKAKIKCF